MLTLERKEGESLIIQHNGEELLITLSEIQDGRAKVSLEGPKSFEVVREELLTN